MVQILPSRRCSGNIPKNQKVEIRGCLAEVSKKKELEISTEKSTVQMMRSTSKLPHFQASSSVSKATISKTIASSRPTFQASRVEFSKFTSLSQISTPLPFKPLSIIWKSASRTSTKGTTPLTVTTGSPEITSEKENSRVTRTLIMDSDHKKSKPINRREEKPWYKSIWHIEILAIMVSGWFLVLVLTICVCATCICKCRTRQRLRAKFWKAESERLKTNEAFQKMESENRDWLQRLMEAKKQPDVQTQQTTAIVQTDRPKTPTCPKPNLTIIPKRGVYSVNPKSQSLPNPNRFVKPDQGVKAKQFRKRGSFEIPIEHLGLQNLQVIYSTNVFLNITNAMENGFVFDKNFSLLKVPKMGVNETIEEEEDVTTL